MARQETETLSSGVDALIERLREEGVSAGRTEADTVLSDARAKAKQIVDDATAKAQQRLDAARKEADSYRSAGEEALKSAMRDTVLDMKARLMERFTTDVNRLVSHHLSDDDMLKQMILAVAGRAKSFVDSEEGANLEVVLPADAVGMDELRRDPDELQKGKLTGFVLGLTGDMLREGITFSASEDIESGIQINVTDAQITVDLSDAAVAALLLKHLQPRFRAILEGIIK